MAYDACLDGEYLDSVIESVGREFLQSMIPTYEQTAKATLANLQEAAAADQLDQVRRFAHQIRSSSTSIGAREVADTARDLEYLAIEATPDVVQGHIDRINAAFAQSLVALARDIGGGQ